MSYKQDKWVWVVLPRKRTLAFVFIERENTVVLRYFDQEAHSLYGYREVVSKRLLEPTNFDDEQRRQLPCGKKTLHINRARMIIAGNKIFVDNPNRKESRVYYCRRCRAFHTTTQMKLPVGFLKTLLSNPYINAEPEDYNRRFYRKRIWKWWHDIIGVNISFDLFESILSAYDENPAKAIRKLKADPILFMHFLQDFMHKYRLKLKMRK